jgi:hypothetical protein
MSSYRAASHHHRFNQELACEPQAGCAERQPNHQLAPPRDRMRSSRLAMFAQAINSTTLTTAMMIVSGC